MEFNTDKQKIIDIFNEILLVKQEEWNQDSLNKILRRYVKNNGKMYRNDELVEHYHSLLQNKKIQKNRLLEERIRLKPTRTNSGVAVVTVLTKPYPCPGRCIYCPNDPSMPKSYISSEPGAQRALNNKFDPYSQVYNRIITLKKIGHNIEKIELIVLGGTWSAYPLDYRIWFINECFKAMNSIDQNSDKYTTPQDRHASKIEWSELKKNQILNESAYCRNVGLVLETRPDYITQDEIICMRKLGATKIQLGIQNLSDKVLNANMVGRSTNDVKNAFSLLRRAGFKIQGHWMPGLYTSTPSTDIREYKRLWKKDFCPDELKIYPVSVIENTTLSNLYKKGKYTPYTEKELSSIIEKHIQITPRYCRISRIIRDIPSNEIEAGSMITNLRQTAEEGLKKKKIKINEIHYREIKGKMVRKEDLQLEVLTYKTSVSKEYFISYKTKEDDMLCAFLRLSIPKKELLSNNFIEELKNSSIIREVHVYGPVVGLKYKSIGESQHLGLGKVLIQKAEQITKKHKIQKISVISAVGTRKYYELNGYQKGKLYMYKDID